MPKTPIYLRKTPKTLADLLGFFYALKLSEKQPIETERTVTHTIGKANYILKTSIF